MIQLVYRSQAVREISSKDILSILNTAEERNNRLQITGLLVYSNHRFMQLLEGESEHVYPLLEAIKQDPRHQDLEIMVDRLAETRCMPMWAMAFGALESQLVGTEKFFIEPDVLIPLCEAMPAVLRQHFVSFLQNTEG